MPAEVIGTQVSVWTLGGNAFVGVLFNAKHEISVKTAEGKGVNATDDYPVPTGRSGRITGQMGIASGGSAVLAGTANSSNPKVAYTETTGAGTYSGTAVLINHSHNWERDGLQTIDVELLTQGVQTVTT